MAAGMAAAEPPTLARVCYYLAPEDIPEFRRAYRQDGGPILASLGMVESTAPQRATIDSACCFLYEARDMESLEQAAARMATHPALSAASEQLRRRFRPDKAPSEWSDWIDFHVYHIPSVQADTVALGPGTGRWRSFYMGDGLPNTEVYSILHASDGTLWLTTGGGVCRYDGRGFETVEAGAFKAGQGVGALAETPDGSIWFARSPSWTGTAPADSGGIFRYHRGRLQRYSRRDGLAGDWVTRSLVADNGDLWLASPGGVSRYRSGTFEGFTPEDGLAGYWSTQLMEDRLGRIWVACGKGVSCLDNERWVALTAEDGLPGDEVYALFEDSKGTIWLATSGGAARVTESLEAAPAGIEGLPPGAMRGIAEGPDGALWFVGEGGLVVVRNGRAHAVAPGGDPWVGWLVRRSMALRGRADGVWVGAGAQGVVRYSGSTETRFSTRDGMAGNISITWTDDRDGNLWVGTNGGVSQFTGASMTTYTASDGLPSDEPVRLLFDRPGTPLGHAPDREGREHTQRPRDPVWRPVRTEDRADGVGRRRRAVVPW